MARKPLSTHQPSNAMSLEVELELLIDPADGARLRRLPLLRPSLHPLSANRG